MPIHPQPHRLRYRQVHLDFHTSPAIPGVGSQFDASQWQDTLLGAAVNSVTLFAKCHHGWSYHPTEVGQRHPHLDLDLLGAQYAATKSAGINAPIYLSSGVDNLASYEHPEWREVDKDGRYTGWAQGSLQAGFHLMDFHSPYLDYLCAQIREVVRLFPDCDGIFLDIISQNQSCSRYSRDFMVAHGLDPLCEADRRESSRLALEAYYQRTTEAATSLRADMPVFHNAGHIGRGDHSILPYFSHLELESLPTGGWGYDHFPMSAKYAVNVGKDFLGMTGKFHTTWGEFGGYKHPNALRYECAAMLAFGAKCSIGDQLHPTGALDRSTYGLIGAAYREVAAKEPWCEGAEQIFDVAILSSEAENHTYRDNPADEGACRALLEAHFLFGLIDRTMDFGRYRAIILPDDIGIDLALKVKLDAYLAAGGKLVLSGESGRWKPGQEPQGRGEGRSGVASGSEAGAGGHAFEIGASDEGLSPYFPPANEPNRGHDYFLPIDGLRADFVAQPVIMYERSRRLRVTTGESLGAIYDPYFNRRWDHFCSHQHTPNQPEPSGFACAVQHGPILTFAHPVFRHYRALGGVAYREFISRALRRFIGVENLTLSTDLPSTARVSLTRLGPVKPVAAGEGGGAVPTGDASGRTVLHVLYAPTVSRGGSLQLSGGNSASNAGIQIIEELPPLPGAKMTLRLPKPPSSARIVPEGVAVAVESSPDGLTHLHLPAFSCHLMVELS